MVSHIILVRYSSPRPSLLRKERSAHDLDSHIFKNFSDLEHKVRGHSRHPKEVNMVKYGESLVQNRM